MADDDDRPGVPLWDPRIGTRGYEIGPTPVDIGDAPFHVFADIRDSKEMAEWTEKPRK